jgi:hypothetical protein
MSETKIFEAEKDKVFATGDSNKLEMKRLETGQVLLVTHLAGTFENLATTEYVVLGYWNGHAYIPLYKAKPDVASDYIFWDGSIYLREGQYLYAYFADVANGEMMKLRANGIWVKWP